MRNTHLPVLSLMLAAAGTHALETTELSLARAQELLIAQAPELRVEKLSEERTRAQLAEARSSYLPSLDVYGSYQAFTAANHLHVELPPPPPPPGPPGPNPPPPNVVDRDLGDKTREEYGIDLTIPLFAGGQRRGQVLSRDAALKASRESARARRNQLSLRLAALYYAWHTADAARATQESLARAHEDFWNRTAAEVRQGAALKSREAAARARWLNAQVDLQAAIDTRDSIARAAALLLGLPPAQAVAFRLGVADTASLAPAAPAVARPELEYLERTSESLEYQERALLGQKFPTLSALAGYRLANPGLNLGSDEYMTYGLVGLQLKWNLFDGFRNRSQRSQIRSQREAVGVERERQAAFWSEAALSADRQAARLEMSLRAAQASLEAAQEGLREKTAQRRQGSASELEWIDATVLEAKAALQVRQLALQGRLAQWQQRFARGETLVFPQGE
jgi:outer membrane protein TolC